MSLYCPFKRKGYGRSRHTLLLLTNKKNPLNYIEFLLKLMKNKTPPRTLQSVLRGFQALELTAASHGGISLKELAARLGIKPPTAHILLNTLVAGGYLTRRPDDTSYYLGDAAFRLAERYAENMLRKGAEKIMRDLASQLPQATIIFAEARDCSVSALFRISPDQPGFLQTPPNRYMAPYTTATGLTFLAFASPEEKTSFLNRHDFLNLGINVWQTLEKLETFLTETRAKGYTLPVFPGHTLQTTAVPVFNQRGQLTAAIGASMPQAEFTPCEAKVISSLLEAAKKIVSP